jgi:hypothetical protein
MIATVTARKSTLIVMRDTLDHPDLELLLDERLVDALRLAGESPVTLTAQGRRTSTAGGGRPRRGLTPPERANVSCAPRSPRYPLAA